MLTDRDQPWWRLEDGWQRYGSKTPKWRCGFCKVEIRGTRWEDRGVCGECIRMHGLDDGRRAA